MVQSGTPCWASWPEQECQCSVLCAGTIPAADPVACGVLPVCGVLPAAGPEDVADAEQALTPSRAATATVSAAMAPRGVRPRRRDFDMPPIMPGAIWCLGRSRPEPLASGNRQDAAAQRRS